MFRVHLYAAFVCVRRIFFAQREKNRVMNVMNDDDSAVVLTGEYGTAWANTIPSAGLVPGQVFVRASPHSGTAYRDPLEQQKAACTAFVTRSCLRDPFPFMHLVVDRLTTTLETFGKTHHVSTPILAYKGGNVFLAIYRAFVKQFPEMARAPLLRGFADAFRYSDADFSIYFDPAQIDPPLAQTLMNEVMTTLQQMRDALLHHAATFFEFEQLRSDVQDEALAGLLAQLRALDPSVVSVSFAGRTTPATAQGADATQWDMRIRFLDPQSEDWIVFEPELRQGRHILYAQDNRALHFPRAHQDIWFDLARLKFAFATRHDHGGVVRLNGELLDVSISRRRAEMQEVWRRRTSWLVRYRIPYENLSVADGDAERVLDVVGLSAEYLVKDLMRVLFADAEFPWLDKKYEKRVHRLLFLLFVETYVGTQQRGQVLRAVRHTLQRLAAMDMTSTEWQSVQSDLRLSSSPFLPFLEALKAIGDKVQAEDRVHHVNDTPSADYAHLMDVCMRDMDTFLTVMARLGAYFDTNAAVPVARIYGR